LYKALFAQPSPANAEEGVQVLTRGPVHEAFAETVTFDPEPGVVAPKAPPAAIEEVPPKQRLEGANVAWIPGYWGWDDERNDFLWVSGIWRALPSGRQWIPGYWGKSAQGFQWTSGYWANAKLSKVEYLPEPPATVEAGPNVAARSPNETWLPGCWMWQNRRYVWRPGFWASVQPNWVWIPAHYVWAPRGYVFVDGYWDYSIGRRGVLFAPVYFNANVYGRRGFSYSPTTAIDLNVFANHLFLRPRYQHYYFGDYYTANYENAGFLPWFSFQANRVGYDPIYAYDRWEHRQDRGWEQRQQADFQNRRDHENLRPPRTWAGQGLQNASEATSRVGLPRVAALLDDLSGNRDSQLRFQPVDQVPPKMYEAPEPDPTVEPKPRANRSADQPRRQAVKTVSEDYKRAKAEFQKKIENHLNELDSKIYNLREKGRNLQTAAKDTWDQKMAELDVKMDTARAKLAEVVRSSADGWKDFRKEAETASDDLDRAFDQASR
jgi:hypothetical protein